MPLLNRIVAALLIVMAVPVSLPVVTASWGASEAEAEQVLLRYFDALSQGDTYTLRSLMAGDQLERRALLLDNPQWPGYLGKTFGNARFYIDRTEMLGPNSVAIEASIVHAEDDVVVRRFILERETSSATPAQAPFRVTRESEPGRE